jgi:hypothetical protein
MHSKHGRCRKNSSFALNGFDPHGDAGIARIDFAGEIPLPSPAGSFAYSAVTIVQGTSQARNRFESSHLPF